MRKRCTLGPARTAEMDKTDSPRRRPGCAATGALTRVLWARRKQGHSGFHRPERTRAPRASSATPGHVPKRQERACPETSGTTLRAAALLLQAAQVPAGKGRENEPWHLRVVGQDSVTSH